MTSQKQRESVTRGRKATARVLFRPVEVEIRSAQGCLCSWRRSFEVQALHFTCCMFFGRLGLFSGSTHLCDHGIYGDSSNLGAPWSGSCWGLGEMEMPGLPVCIFQSIDEALEWCEDHVLKFRPPAGFRCWASVSSRWARLIEAAANFHEASSATNYERQGARLACAGTWR